MGKIKSVAVIPEPVGRPKLRVAKCEPESIRPMAEDYLNGLTAYHLTDGDNSGFTGLTESCFTDLWKSIPIDALLSIVPRFAWTSLEHMAARVLEAYIVTELHGSLSEDEFEARYGKLSDEYVSVYLEVWDGLKPQA